jgi:hypothetical protein
VFIAREQQLTAASAVNRYNDTGYEDSEPDQDEIPNIGTGIHTVPHLNSIILVFPVGGNVIGIFAYTPRRCIVRKLSNILKAHG